MKTDRTPQHSRLWINKIRQVQTQDPGAGKSIQLISSANSLKPSKRLHPDSRLTKDRLMERSAILRQVVAVHTKGRTFVDADPLIALEAADQQKALVRATGLPGYGMKPGTLAK